MNGITSIRPGRSGIPTYTRPSYYGVERLSFEQEMERARSSIEQQRADLAGEVARGNLSISQANLHLERYIADINADLSKKKMRLEEQLGMKKLGIEKELGLGELAEKKAERRAKQAWRGRLYGTITSMAGGGGTSPDLGALEERLYMPAQRNITEQMRVGLAGLPGEATGAGYGGRSSWEDRQRAGILTSGVRAIGDVRSQAGVQATRIRLEEAERARQSRGQMAAALAGLGG